MTIFKILDLRPTLAAILCSILLSPLLYAKEAPSLTGPVVDKAGVLTQNEVSKLGQAIKDYYLSSGHQLQVLVIDSLEGDSLEDFSMRVAEKWRTGNKEGTGVILVVSVKDRKLRIEVGQGAEGYVTDADAGRIISDIITPEFRAGNYYGGVAGGLSRIAGLLGGDFKIDYRTKSNLSSRKMSGIPIFIIFLVVFFLLPRIFRSGGGGGFLTGMLLGSMLRGGGGSGRSFGGGGWSGGGGGFSGGGASGSW